MLYALCFLKSDNPKSTIYTLYTLWAIRRASQCFQFFPFPRTAYRLLLTYYY
jgi:hypothetical protein